MLSIIAFLVLIAAILIHSTPIIQESCTVKILNSSLPCWTGITSPRTCKSAILNLGDTKYKSCTTVGLGWWSDSTNSLTINIETPFTQERQPYSIYLNNEQLKQFKDYDVKIYRILNGQETELISSDDVIIQSSDSNYQVILKFQGPTMYNVLPIIYEVVKT
ncbi:unnamed protein product [Rotaria sordida]|uniref:Uncharacterized protein n=1 Tax=Rotaria sordida TaxID=392033 RepID=A0A814REI9_9BILA|nr:unnamed protein product [Rotaria sordida]CAF1006899.1 unnamed protein product [Rotaria sordida]CAF1131196.1 unnamed protein product [Rotaria sordida]CAF1354017.1 unnamed protein product [Rotaria sordida]CAF3752209.1 unnamed protein product [Rotaria sordida]